MAFVDLSRQRLILKIVLAGPPEVGKSQRLEQIAAIGSRHDFGTHTTGRTRMARLALDTEKDGRPVELEVYEWHGPERADVRAKGLFVGLDGLIYLADAREDRYVDSIRTFEFVRDRIGKSKIARLAALLMLGRMDEGLLRLGSFASKLHGPTWSQHIECLHREEAEFLEALRLYGDVMLARTL